MFEHWIRGAREAMKPKNIKFKKIVRKQETPKKTKKNQKKDENKLDILSSLQKLKADKPVHSQ